MKRPSALRAALPALFALVAIFAFVFQAHAAPPSTTLTVDGAVTTPATYDLDALRARPAVSQSVTIGGRTRTFVGTSLYALVAASGIETRPSVRNDLLSKVIVAIGSDGYRVVRSVGELDPDYGGRPDLVAYADATGGTAVPLAGDGFVRATAPGDVKGGRSVTNLTTLRVRPSASTKTGGGGPSTSFSVSGDVVTPTTFDATTLRALPASGATVGGTAFTGVSLWTLLRDVVGVAQDAGMHNGLLARYVVATGSDGYQVVFSLGELDPAFGNRPVLVAYEADGRLLGAQGFARLVVPNDAKPGRRVANLASLEVFSIDAGPGPP